MRFWPVTGGFSEPRSRGDVRRWRPSGSGLFLFHLVPIPVADLARSHQRDAVMADDIVEQSFQIFDAMRNTRDVGVDRDCHDPRVASARSEEHTSELQSLR